MHGHTEGKLDGVGLLLVVLLLLLFVLLVVLLLLLVLLFQLLLVVSVVMLMLAMGRGVMRQGRGRQHDCRRGCVQRAVSVCRQLCDWGGSLGLPGLVVGLLCQVIT